MQTALFDFDLPPDRIAQAPADPRDSARLLKIGGTLSDHIVRDLPALLRPGDLIVVNDTKVIPARMEGRRGEARVELTLHTPESPHRWQAFARPAKRLKPGDRVEIGPGFAVSIEEKREGGRFVVALDSEDPIGGLQRYGRAPLPPYIRRKDTSHDAADSARYQTVYARRDGAVAAPTAGLHFTEDLFAALRERGVGLATVTLHVGPGTFLPVKADDARDHRMHAEYGEMSPATAEAVNRTHAEGGRVLAVGSTALRLLETAAQEDGTVAPFAGETDLFILPGYRFKVVDLMLTNFHLPRSTLFMLVSAFSGLERMRRAYAHAVDSGYRFYSFGDACLLEPAP